MLGMLHGMCVNWSKGQNFCFFEVFLPFFVYSSGRIFQPSIFRIYTMVPKTEDNRFGWRNVSKRNRFDTIVLQKSIRCKSHSKFDQKTTVFFFEIESKFKTFCLRLSKRFERYHVKSQKALVRGKTSLDHFCSHRCSTSISNISSSKILKDE